MKDFTKNRVSVYLKDPVLDSILKEAERLDRSISWLLTTSWEIAKEKLALLPTVDKGVYGK